jgi:hypothetical protein
MLFGRNWVGQTERQIMEISQLQVHKEQACTHKKTHKHMHKETKRYIQKTEHKQTHTHICTKKHARTHTDGCINGYDRLDMQLIQGNYMESQDRKTCWEVTTSKMDITAFNRLWY